MARLKFLKHHELLRSFILRELSGRYRRSRLGLLWSVMHPLVSMAIYAVVFKYLLRTAPPAGDPSGLNVFALWVMTGLLPWLYFANTTSFGLQAVVDNDVLVKHVAFPRELLVLGVIGAQSVTLLIEFLILLIALIVVGNVSLLWLPCLVLLLVLLVCFTTGITLGLAAAYVYLRDLSHLWSVMIQLGFFTTPVIYHLELLPDRLRNIVSLNPMTSFVVAFRDVLYNLRWPNPAILMTITGWTVVAVCFGLYTFARLEPRFAEEL